MALIALLILAAVVAALIRPRTPAPPIVIYVDREPHAEGGAGGCLPTAMALVAIGVLIVLLAA